LKDQRHLYRPSFTEPFLALQGSSSFLETRDHSSSKTFDSYPACLVRAGTQASVAQAIGHQYQTIVSIAVLKPFVSFLGFALPCLQFVLRSQVKGSASSDSTTRQKCRPHGPSCTAVWASRDSLASYLSCCPANHHSSRWAAPVPTPYFVNNSAIAATAMVQL